MNIIAILAAISAGGGASPLAITGSSGKSIAEEVDNGLQTSTGTSSVTAEGGIGEVTYTWVRVSGSSAVNPTDWYAADTQWESYGTSETNSATFKCVVADNVDTLEETGYVISMLHGLPP